MVRKRFAAVVFACCCILLTGAAQQTQQNKKAKADGKSASTSGARKKPGPVGDTNIHVFPDDCRSQEPMVHADPKGKVIFTNMSKTTQLKLTFLTNTVFEDSSDLNLDPGKSDSRKVKDLPSGVDEVYTQYKINDCTRPSVVVHVKPKPNRGGSDPNDITVP